MNLIRSRCVVCGDYFLTTNKTKNTCDDRCKKQLGDRRITKISSKAWATLVEYAMERDGYKCTRCGCEEKLHCHHIVPKALGGSDDPENLVMLCDNCHGKEHVAIRDKQIDRSLDKMSAMPFFDIYARRTLEYLEKTKSRWENGGIIKNDRY